MGVFSDLLCLLGAHDRQYAYLREGSCETRVSCLRTVCDWEIFTEPHQFDVPEDYENWFLNDRSCEVMGVCSRCGFGPGPEVVDTIHDWDRWHINTREGRHVTQRSCGRCGEYQYRPAGPQPDDGPAGSGY